MNAESAALRELSQIENSELAGIWRACVDRISYLALVLLVMLLVLTFIMIKIVPQYVSIFQEFDLALPALTQLAVATANLFTNYLAAPFALLFVLLVFFAIFVGICYLADLPVLEQWSDRVFRGRRTADVLRILAVATEQRQPLADVLTRVAYVYPSATIRRQLAPAAQAINSGGRLARGAVQSTNRQPS